MKTSLRKLWTVALAALLICLCAGVASAQGQYAVTATLPVRNGETQVLSKTLDGDQWLFLPAHADLSALRLTVSPEIEGELLWQENVPYQAGAPVDWLALATESQAGVYAAPLTNAQGDTVFTLHVMRSENLRALYLFSDDPIAHGREWLEDCKRHVNETSGSMALIAPSGAVDHLEKVSNLRGRGNATWYWDKRPYQLKLENKVNLLDTGDPDERSRTWVLLAMAADSSLLHDKLTLDLGLEMGMEETARSEHVDLYYDGDYRGTYLLCEKNEVGKGRIAIRDFDKILKEGNERQGIADVESLPVEPALNRFGNKYLYIDGVAAPQDVSAGGYMLELESVLTLSDRCWFDLSNRERYAFKSPENPSAAMAQYVSELLEEGWQAAIHHGTDPETGVTVNERFDLEAFARVMLVSELAANVDGVVYSSSFFVLPEGQTRFLPGTLWDFDLAWRYRTEGGALPESGAKDTRGWLYELYGCKAFRDMARKVYTQELKPLIDTVLLGNGAGRYLQPLDDYVSHIAASRRMNERIWETQLDWRLEYGDTYEQDIEQLRAFIGERSLWLADLVESWDGSKVAEAAFTLDVVYTHVPDTLRLSPVLPWATADVRSCDWQQVSEATEEDFALWRGEMVVEPLDGTAFAPDAVIKVNGTPLASELQSDGSLRVSFLFEDPSYRPADYYGDDMGLVYNADWYAEHYPEAAEAAEGDPEALLEDFYYEGMLEGRKGNEFFDPIEIQFNFPDEVEYLGEDWEQYYWRFLTDTDNPWMLRLDKRFTPAVTEAKEP